MPVDAKYMSVTVEAGSREPAIDEQGTDPRD
jgi:hypothetical protein